MAEKRNNEGYFDPTAYLALRNIEKSERRKNKMKRGEIYYIQSLFTQGSEQKAGRPAIIVSNNKNNQYSEVVEVVYLTTKQKTDLPTHVTIRSTERESIALCEQIVSVSKGRIGDYKGCATDTEMANLDIALMISLGIETTHNLREQKVAEIIKEVPVPVNDDGGAESTALKEQLTMATVKYEMLQSMYDSLLARVLGANAV